MSTKGKRSAVWQYFKVTENKTNVKCYLCNKTFKFHKNTSNLHEHLKRVHTMPLLTIQLEDSHNQTPTNLSSTFSTESFKTAKIEGSTQIITSTASGSACESQICTSPIIKRYKKFHSTRTNSELSENEVDEITKTLIKMIAKDYQPFRIVDDKGFQEFVKILNPSYTLPSRKALSYELLPNIYAEEIQKLEIRLEQISTLAITTEMWTSDSNLIFVTVTVHFIGKFWIIKIKSVILLFISRFQKVNQSIKLFFKPKK